MKKHLLFVLSLAICSALYAQKPPIDTAAIHNWPMINGDAIINDDGTYVAYSVNNDAKGMHTLVVQHTTDLSKQEFADAADPVFTKDDRRVIFMKGDTLCFLTLGSKTLTRTPHVASYKQFLSENQEWIAYETRSPAAGLFLYNLRTDEKRAMGAGADYYFEKSGRYLAFCTQKGTGDLIIYDIADGTRQGYPHTSVLCLDKTGKGLLVRSTAEQNGRVSTELKWLNFGNNVPGTIWTANTSPAEQPAIFNLCFDTRGEQLAFMVGNGSKEYSIWYYKTGDRKAELKLDDRSAGIDSGTLISDEPISFNPTGHFLLFKTRPLSTGRTVRPDAVSVDIWNYQDRVLQSEQLKHRKEQQPALTEAALDVKRNKITVVNGPGEEDNLRVGDYALISRSFGTDSWWRPDGEKQQMSLISLSTGTRKIIVNYFRLSSVSPISDRFIYQSPDDKNYYCYDVKKNSRVNLSAGIPCDKHELNFAAWLNDGSGAIFYDHYDIWEVGIDGAKKAICMTNGYGRKHRIILRIHNSSGVIVPADTLLLTAFNDLDYSNGFYSAVRGEKKDPKLLTIGPFLYILPDHVSLEGGSIQPFGSNSMYPKKALKANTWILSRMTASEAPNYYLTKDFRSFQPLSALKPQESYNWLSSELITWKQKDGKMTKGVLYKPENFDPKRKYPLIFHYYEKHSYRLHQYPLPGLATDDINIPWFVSRGYLVFDIDFHQSMATVSNTTNGENSILSITGAVKYICKRPYVDPAKMGLQGHSFGGGQTNYIITHAPHVFAAAAEAAGSSDAVSTYLTLAGGVVDPGPSRQEGIEGGFGRMGASLWQRPDLYLRNSSILSADKVTTPLLIMHNMADGAVPWNQGVEMFLALRRLDKKVWMLQYDNDSHSVLLDKDALDYTTRLTQFFDYYLKGSPPPKWMTVGVPAKMKGIDDGLELDLRPGHKP